MPNSVIVEDVNSCTVSPPILGGCIQANRADPDQGAPFQWAAIFDKSSVSFTKGVQGLGFYCSSHCSRQYEVPTKVSCTFCHTPILDEGRQMCLLFPESIQVPPEDWQRFRTEFQVSCVNPTLDTCCVEWGPTLD